ncbi:hypothetical protein, partial [Nonomuraea sp. KM90]|uniref:hypothetical protein n=1 Tax=Nonomuraea sp. KM90 TaxID=3457428 RepID=UPI003FCE0C17
QNIVPHTYIGTATAGSIPTKQIVGAFSLAVGRFLLAHHLAGVATAACVARGVGVTLGWVGSVGGLLALVAIVLMPDLRVAGPGPAAGKPTAAAAQG